MRILHCTDTWPPQLNGVSVVTATSVAGLVARGWDAAVIAPRERRAPALPDAAIDLTTVPSTILPIYPEVRVAMPDYASVARAIRRFQPDLVHCQTEFILGQLGHFAARRAGVAVVTSFHTDFPRYARAYGIGWLNPVIRAWLARFHGRAQRTYTPSASARDALVALGVDDVEVWGRGVDLSTFTPTRFSAELRRSIGVNDAFLFVHVGRLAAEKNVEVIIEAWRRTSARLPPGSARLVIAGTGPRLRALQALAPTDVIFLGALDRRTVLPMLYASADAFLFASVTETLGLVVLEAMASGTPVIAAPAGGVADQLRDGDNGLAYPPNDAAACADRMVRMVVDPGLVERLRVGALRTASARSWERELDRLDASYREVIAAPSAARLRPTAFARAV